MAPRRVLRQESLPHKGRLNKNALVDRLFSLSAYPSGLGAARTYLTVSAAWAFSDGPYHQAVRPGTLVGAERREARAEALDNFRRLLALPYPKAIENPAPSFVSNAIRPPDQTIQPYEFGDDASKRTGLWLDRLPALVPTRRVRGRMVEWPRGSGKMVERWSNQSDGGQNKLPPSEDRWLERSKTYPGIADAMGDQWGNPHQMRMAI